MCVCVCVCVCEKQWIVRHPGFSLLPRNKDPVPTCNGRVSRQWTCVVMHRVALVSEAPELDKLFCRTMLVQELGLLFLLELLLLKIAFSSSVDRGPVWFHF